MSKGIIQAAALSLIKKLLGSIIASSSTKSH